MIYFDNSASTYFKPPCVINAVKDALLTYTANPGRSGHNPAIQTEMQLLSAREMLTDFLNAPRLQNIIFTQNCTDALNLAILGSVRKNGHVITSSNEHNSVLRPLFALQREGKISLSVISPKAKGKIVLSDIVPFVKKNTYLIAVTHLSNVDGTKTNAAEIGEFCRQSGILFLLDAAQSAGHLLIDMKQMNIDMVALAGHKGLLGPQGIGVLALSERASPYLTPIRFGGTGTESVNPMPPQTLPERFESGTPATPAIIGLREGVQFVSRNFRAINRTIEQLSLYLLGEMQKIPAVELYTLPDSKHGIISFNVKNHSSTDVANFLNEEYEICVRAGLHCAPLKHKENGTLERGTVRISLAYTNSIEECNVLLDALRKLNIA